MGNPFAMKDTSRKEYVSFPNDEYIDACVLSYQVADLPPGPLSATTDPVPSTRFLFGGYVKDSNGNILMGDDGKPVLVRKWSRWMRISNNEKSAMMKTFNGFDNLFDLLQDCEANGRLWTTPMKILCELANGQAGKNGYQNITRIKPGTNHALVAEAFYDEKYIPYKVVRAYGRAQPLRVAGCKFASGVRTFDPDTMADAPQEG